MGVSGRPYSVLYRPVPASVSILVSKWLANYDAQTLSGSGMTIPPKLDGETALKMARERVEEISASLPTRVDPAGLTLKSKLPFKALSLREVLIHRVSELAECAMEQFETNRIVSAFVLARAVLETVALIYWLHKKLLEFFDSKDIVALDDFLMKAMLGSKDESTAVDSYNVLTAVDHVDKEYENFRTMYDSLCEFTHPNWSGTLGAYGKIERGSLDLGADIKSPPLRLGLGPFVGGLEIFIEYYNNLERLIHDLNDYCETSDRRS